MMTSSFWNCLLEAQVDKVDKVHDGRDNSRSGVHRQSDPCWQVGQCGTIAPSPILSLPGLPTHDQAGHVGPSRVGN